MPHLHGEITAQICGIILPLKWEVENKDFYDRDGEEKKDLDFFSKQ